MSGHCSRFDYQQFSPFVGVILSSCHGEESVSFGRSQIVDEQILIMVVLIIGITIEGDPGFFCNPHIDFLLFLTHQHSCAFTIAHKRKVFCLIYRFGFAECVCRAGGQRLICG